MKAIYLTQFGKSGAESFEIQETQEPSIEAGQVKIKTQAFGLNYADVMCRLGLYNDRPDLPCVIGYEVVGEVAELGSEVMGFEKGEGVSQDSQEAMRLFRLAAAKGHVAAQRILRSFEQRGALHGAA